MKYAWMIARFQSSNPIFDTSILGAPLIYSILNLLDVHVKY